MKIVKKKWSVYREKIEGCEKFKKKKKKEGEGGNGHMIVGGRGGYGKVM